MAMVFKAKRDILELTKKDLAHPGPGDYIPQTIYKKSFLTSKVIHKKIKKNINNKKDNTPGPGYYFKNDNIKSRSNKTEILLNKTSILKKTSEDKLNEKNNDSSEKLGFNIKSIRFNTSKDLEPPGPGQYFSDINKCYKTNFENKIREKYKLRRLNRNKPKFDLIPSIPSRDQQYGFNILEDGNLEHKKPPNFNQTFTGEKSDSVGPGSYNITKDNELYKTSPKWSISKYPKGTKSLRSTNFTDNSKFIDNNSNNSNYLLSSITANKFYIDENRKVKESSSYNISSNSLGSFSNSYYLNSFRKNESAQDIIKKSTYIDTNFKRVPLFFKHDALYNKGKKENHKREIQGLSFKSNNNPGPGCYINIFKNSSFNFKSYPAGFQFFGSRAKRFNYPNELPKVKELNTNNLQEEFNPKKSKESSIPFLTSDERFKISKDKALFPSPTEYFPEKIKKSKSFSNFNKFGSIATRFIEKSEIKRKNAFPGPGMYNPQKIKSHINTKKMIMTKDYNNEIFIYKNALNYNINTIAYENYKKSSSTNLNTSVFFRTNPPLKKTYSTENINSSPGFYYVDKKREVKQVIPPFHSSANRIITFHSSFENRVGPGHYRNDSYFDWNKKSFNINYV